jgi:hypothetical protein
VKRDELRIPGGGMFAASERIVPGVNFAFLFDICNPNLSNQTPFTSHNLRRYRGLKPSMTLCRQAISYRFPVFTLLQDYRLRMRGCARGTDDHGGAPISESLNYAQENARLPTMGSQQWKHLQTPYLCAEAIRCHPGSDSFKKAID